MRPIRAMKSFPQVEQEKADVVGGLAARPLRSARFFLAAAILLVSAALAPMLI